MSKRWKKMVALGLAAVLCMLPACGKTNTSGPAGTEGGSVAEENQGAGGNEGISEDSPYKDKGFDLSKHEDVRWNLSRGFSAKHNVSENSVQNICRAVSPQRMRIIGSMVFFYL